MDIAVSPTPEIVEKVAAPKVETPPETKVENTGVVENKPKTPKPPTDLERISAVVPKKIINTLRNYVSRTPDKTLTSIYHEALAEYLVNHDIAPTEGDKQDIALKRGRRPKVVPSTETPKPETPPVVESVPVVVESVPVIDAIVTTPVPEPPPQTLENIQTVVVEEPVVESPPGVEVAV